MMTIPNETTTNTSMINDNIPEKIPSYFSYLIRPATPCIFGTEIYNDKSLNDDEFFLTAGGIIHSCPNIYELSSIENEYKHRKLQSCEHLLFLTQPTTTSINNNLNTYDTEFSRYSIIPRFQTLSSSLSIDSMNSEIELYQQRHANGLSRKYTNSSFLPTTWKSDNYLLFMSIVNHQQSSSLINSNQRSRSFEQRISSVI
jgi:hypothetical protein